MKIRYILAALVALISFNTVALDRTPGKVVHYQVRNFLDDVIKIEKENGKKTLNATTSVLMKPGSAIRELLLAERGLEVTCSNKLIEDLAIAKSKEHKMKSGTIQSTIRLLNVEHRSNLASVQERLAEPDRKRAVSLNVGCNVDVEDVISQFPRREENGNLVAGHVIATITIQEYDE